MTNGLLFYSYKLDGVPLIAERLNATRYIQRQH
jgi:hypothetical protein